MRPLTVLVMVCALSNLTVLTAPAFAFDGKRRGFVLGGSLGASTTTSTQTLTSSIPGYDGGNSDVSGLGAAADLRIGNGFTDRLVVYLIGSTVITSAFGYSLLGIGGSYYARPEAPSFYILAAGGYARIEDTSPGVFSVLPAQGGKGFNLGVGWEFDDHFSVEAAVSWRAGSVAEGPVPSPLPIWLIGYEPGVETNAISLYVTVVGLAY